MVTRGSDARIVDLLVKAIGIDPPGSIIEIGAGTGNYAYALAELGYKITALEPSDTMRGQAKPHPRVSWKDGLAEKLPFEDSAFDAAIMVMAAHHFSDLTLALSEALRVTRFGRLIMFTFDPDLDQNFWLFNYFPTFRTQMRQTFPPLNKIAEISGCRMTVQRFPLPNDLRDHFAASGWNRPEIYLDPKYRAGISSFFLTNQQEVASGLLRLSADLADGRWDDQFGRLRDQAYYDAGYVCLQLTDSEPDSPPNGSPGGSLKTLTMIKPSTSIHPPLSESRG